MMCDSYEWGLGRCERPVSVSWEHEGNVFHFCDVCADRKAWPFTRDEVDMKEDRS